MSAEPSIVSVTSSDVIEFITLSDGTPVSTVFTQVEEAMEFLKELLLFFCIQVILDLHGVADLADKRPFLPGSVCGLSYVGHAIGPKKSMRVTARETLGERIQSGQLAFAILVFKRGSKIKNPATGNYELLTEQGSKAAVVMFIQEIIGKHCLFMDDSKDHILSTKQLGGDAVYATLSLKKDLTTKTTREMLHAFKVHAVEIPFKEEEKLREWISLWATKFIA
jgi:hypothetical protein